MSTRVKIVIASVIIGALVVLIVLDRSTATHTANNDSADTADTADSIFQPDRVDPEKKNSRVFANSRDKSNEKTLKFSKDDKTGIFDKVKNAMPDWGDQIKGPDKADQSDKIKGPEKKPVKVPTAPKKNESYTVVEGDSFYKIAEKVYGKADHWKVIADANPTVKPYALRVGKTITIPPKPETPKTAKDAVTTADGSKVYTVRPGDTLTGISQSLFGTIKYADRIFEINSDTLSSVDSLVVGQKLNLPDVTVKPTTKKEPRRIPAGARIHTVEHGDSLWKIAERYRAGKGILEMMDTIVAANTGRLASKTTTLKVGWTLVIPE